MLILPNLQVVDKNSAIIDGSHKIGFETVHRNLQRFSNRDDENYQDILSWIRDWANKAKKEADGKCQ